MRVRDAQGQRPEDLRVTAETTGILSMLEIESAYNSFHVSEKAVRPDQPTQMDQRKADPTRLVLVSWPD